MKSLLKVLHLPELIFIIIAQYLFRLCIIKPYFGDVPMQVNNLQFFLLVVASVCVAAGGFLIKYYFDARHYDASYITKMYEIDKPLPMHDKLNTAFIALSAVGSLLGFAVGYGIGMFNLGLIFMLASTVLYFYALRYQGLLFWGNLAIGFITVLIIGMVWLFEYFAVYKQPEIFTSLIPQFKVLNSYLLLYTVYGFLMAFILKMTKDLTKTEQDKECFFKTFPVVLGEKQTRMLVIALSAVLIALMVILPIVFFSSSNLYLTWVMVILVQLPLLFACSKMVKARSVEDYKFVFNFLRWSMFLSIFTMVAATHNTITQWIS